MKVIFLDVDGVLNTEQLLADSQLAGNELNALGFDHLQRLQKIQKETGAVIVLSSDWRHPELQPAKEIVRAALFIFGMKLGGSTPDLLGIHRCREIESWLVGNRDKGVESFVILDDMFSAGLSGRVDFRHRFVRTNDEFGLLDEHVDKALEILNTALSDEELKTINKRSRPPYL